jgi:hypothetical protein
VEVLEGESRRTRSQYVENSLWKGLCRNTDWGMMMMIMMTKTTTHCIGVWVCGLAGLNDTEQRWSNFRSRLTVVSHTIHFPPQYDQQLSVWQIFFGSAYLNEEAFSQLKIMQTKYRRRVADQRAALSASQCAPGLRGAGNAARAGGGSSGFCDSRVW